MPQNYVKMRNCNFRGAKSGAISTECLLQTSATGGLFSINRTENMDDDLANTVSGNV